MTMNDDCWYFAYGSNLLKEQMQGRTREVRQPQVCRLAEHRLAFNKQGKGDQVYANIMPDTGSEVWGVIYRCSPAAMKELDRYEGVAAGHYHRQQIEVIGHDGATVKAVTYVAGDDHVCPDGQPSDEYLGRFLQGANQHCLPSDYIEGIKLLAKRDRGKAG